MKLQKGREMLKVLVDNNGKVWLEVAVEQGGGPTLGAQETQYVTSTCVIHPGNICKRRLGGQILRKWRNPDTFGHDKEV